MSRKSMLTQGSSRVYVRLQITHVKKNAMRKATTATMSRAPMSRKTWDGVAGFPPLHLTNWHERTEPQQTQKNPTQTKETHKNPVPAMRSYVYLTSYSAVGRWRTTLRLLLVTTALLLGTVGMILGRCALQGYFASGQCRDTTPWAPQEYCGAGHCRDTLLSGAAGIPSGCCHYCAVTGHCKDTLWLRTAGILGGRAMQGYSAVGHCRNTWWLGTAGILGLVVGHCKDTLRLGTALILSSWALQGYSAVGHYCRDTLRLGLSRKRCHSAAERAPLHRSRVPRARAPRQVALQPRNLLAGVSILAISDIGPLQVRHEGRFNSPV